MYDVCVIGHITRDRIEIAGSPVRVQPGGTLYYSSLTAARLGLRTVAITRIRHIDRSLLLNGLQTAGISVRAIDSLRTTEYVNSFSIHRPDERRQRVLSVAEPFYPDDINAAADVYLFGPLTHSDIRLECVERAASTGGIVAMDIQGLLRHVRDSRVEHVRSAAAIRMLRRVDILKAGRDEALLITGERTIEAAAQALAAAGPREVLVTSGGFGSHVLAGGELSSVPAYAPSKVVDTTGCGDTYLAAYVAHRLDGASPEEAGHSASRVAGAKTAYHGAFRGDVSDVQPVSEAAVGVSPGR